MSVSLKVLQDHIAYTAWATRRVADAAAHLPPEELARDFRTADRSILDTLVHIFGSDRVWLARIQGAPSPGRPAPADHDMAYLQTAFPALHERWREWASSFDPDTDLTYTDFKGNSWTQPLWQIVLHVVNHGTHHRGQISGFLRSMGHTPPPLDLAAWQRKQF